MSRLKILEIKGRLERLERLQEERRNEAAEQRLNSALSLQAKWQNHEREHQQIRVRLNRLERVGAIKTLFIVFLLGAGLWSINQ